MKKNMMTFEEFKNDFARSYAYPDWKHLQDAYAERLNDPYEYIRKVNAVSVRYVAYVINKNHDLSFESRVIWSFFKIAVGFAIGMLINKIS